MVNQDFTVRPFSTRTQCNSVSGVHVCKYKSGHCMFVCDQVQQEKKVHQIAQESWSLRQLGKNYMRIHKPG